MANCDWSQAIIHYIHVTSTMHQPDFLLHGLCDFKGAPCDRVLIFLIFLDLIHNTNFRYTSAPLHTSMKLLAILSFFLLKKISKQSKTKYLKTMRV